MHRSRRYRSIFILTIAWLFAALAVSSASDAADGDAKSQAQMKAYKERVGEKLEFVPIPGGKFKMGSPADEKGRKDDEGPQIEVEIEPFWMGKYEVTADDFYLYHDNERYQAAKKSPVPAEKLVDAVSIPTPTFPQEHTPILKGLGDKGGYPITDISRFGAMQFTKWLSKKTGRFYRLPTEAEWEYACRAGSVTAYSWGNDPSKLNDYAWNFDNSLYDDQKTGYPRNDRDIYPQYAGFRKVGLKKPNAWDLHDMHGNVAEWVLDAYDAEHYAKFVGKTPTSAQLINWPKRVFPTVYRGGSWISEPALCRSASREVSSKKLLQDLDPQEPKSPWWYTDAFHIGIRVVRPLKEPTEEEKRRYWDTDIPELIDVLEKSNLAANQAKILVEPPK